MEDLKGEEAVIIFWVETRRKGGDILDCGMMIADCGVERQDTETR
jgi:hypothetical protein